MSTPRRKVVVRNTRREDFRGIGELSLAVYPHSPPWNETQLGSHLEVFPEGQFVAIEAETNKVVGMAASLIVLWDDYDMTADWATFTNRGLFTNHDPARGRTLYGAEVIVHPTRQGAGIGKKIYAARRELTERLGLLRIRAGARLPGYHKHAQRMSAEDYVARVVQGRLGDPTLSFQLKQGFHVLAVAGRYLMHDPESQEFAAVIEWLNSAVATPADYAAIPRKFLPPEKRDAASV